MIFLTVSHPRPVTTAKSVTVIIPHRLSTKAWSREVYQTYGGAKGGKPRSSGRTPDTRTGAPPSPATRASSRWAPSATLETVCPCASPGRCGIADISATPVVPPARTGYSLLRILSAHSRNPSVHQTHDRANFDSSMELNSYVQAGTSRMNPRTGHRTRRAKGRCCQDWEHGGESAVGPGAAASRGYSQRERRGSRQFPGERPVWPADAPSLKSHFSWTSSLPSIGLGSKGAGSPPRRTSITNSPCTGASCWCRLCLSPGAKGLNSNKITLMDTTDSTSTERRTIPTAAKSANAFGWRRPVPVIVGLLSRLPAGA